MAFIAGGFWELWSVAIPLAPVVMILLGIGLLLWYFTRKLNGRKQMF
jgi:CHASE2 domain-containing sensor protein